MITFIEQIVDMLPEQICHTKISKFLHFPSQILVEILEEFCFILILKILTPETYKKNTRQI